MANRNEDLGTELTMAGTEIKLKSLNVFKPRRERRGSQLSPRAVKDLACEIAGRGARSFL